MIGRRRTSETSTPPAAADGTAAPTDPRDPAPTAAPRATGPEGGAETVMPPGPASLGPVADPAPIPPGGLGAPATPGSTAGPAAPAAHHHIRRTRSGTAWTAFVVAGVLLVLLLIFILQNSEDVKISYLGAHGSLPLGVALLLSAVCGLLLVAIPGVARMYQLRRVARRHAAGRPS
jgi:uncharacterized integral membrane protein